MNKQWGDAARKAVRAASLVLIVKGAVGGSFALLGLFGVAAPAVGSMFGFDPGPDAMGSGFAATAGAILGILVALKA